MPKTSVILLAGGSGTRMQSDIPKQYLPLADKCVARHSFELFASMSEVDELVVVCHPDYQQVFAEAAIGIPVAFAQPGARRQDSVYNGLQKVSADIDLVCIHDSARPLVSRKATLRALEAAQQIGAATVAVPIKVTVKKGRQDQLVESTLDRSQLWEIQTPQVIRTALLREAFAHALANDLTVTDDVSLVEALGHPVKLVLGDYFNLKITTPEDLAIANALLTERLVF